jgi:hypothetical protein
MAGNTRRVPALGDLIKPTAIAVGLAALADMVLDFVTEAIDDDDISADMGDVVINNLIGGVSELAIFGAVAYVFVVGTDTDALPKLVGGVYAVVLAEDLLWILKTNGDASLVTFLNPLYSVIFFLGFVAVFRLFAESRPLLG